jgi:A/G-specific adenine glycosylase
MKSSPISPDVRPRFQEALLDHYDRLGRYLPWRRDADPYRVLVSEVMLQQTRVETVKGYYGPWMEQFPDIEALALADEDKVLKAWEGLGYYRRARNLHRAARVIREGRGGSFPSRYTDLLELPGVGEYTAGAVASIAFGEPVPAVDGNVRRVLARLFDVSEPSAVWLREVASLLVREARPGDWNQALMELGATVCTPRSPRCAECPVRVWCAAREAGTQLERPVAKRRGPVPRVTIGVGVFCDDERVLLVRRPETGLLGGMWAFPEVMLSGERNEQATDSALTALAREMGIEPSGVARPLADVRHRFTHLDVTYRPVCFDVVSSYGVATGHGTDHRRVGPRAWVGPSDISAFALPVAQRKILESSIEQREGRRTPPTDVGTS